MSDLIKEVLMGKLFGTGTGSGGSSGGGGGSSSGVSPKEVNFYDYDGTCVYAYSVAEAQALSALPAGPEHPGLVFQGWNWSLEGVKGLTRAMNIGAMYTTDDGTTRLYITLQEGRTSPMLGVGVNGTVTVDWGDGTEADVLTGTSVSSVKWTPNHAYAAPGDYVIRLTVEGEMGFTGSSSTNQYACILRYASGADARNRVYQNALQRVEIGSGVTSIGSYAFQGCYSLAFVTIPDGVTNIATRAFNSCYSLAFVTIPDSVTSIGTHAFIGCNSLAYLIIPDSLTSIASNTFQFCNSLASLTIPDSVTSIGSYAFQGCYSLAFVTIPDSVTSIGSYAFDSCNSLASLIIPDSVTSIGSSTFSSCNSLAFVTIPDSVTSIGSSTFSSCSGMAFYDFTACTAVPTLASTNAFNGIPADCIFLIPSALYDEWIAATNWTTYADRCVAK